MKALRILLVVVVAACLPLVAQDGINGNLVTTKWLEKNLKGPDVLLLDVTNPGAYAKEHIPGAVDVPMMVVNNPFGPVDIPPAQMEKMYQQVGISADKKIVLYDHNGDESAPRAFFSLYYHGLPVKNLFILDGGLKKWKLDNLPVTTEPTKATPNPSFKISKRVESARADTQEILTATGDPKSALIDALGTGWHFGGISPFNRAGHIPNSYVVDKTELYNADGTFKSAEEIRKFLDYYGIRPDQTVYSFCGGGIAAAGPYFAAKFIAGYPNVKLYPGSEMIWLADQRDLPYWTYDAPYLMRNVNWVQFFAGQMLRSYVGTDIDIIDVRPADDYSQGHLPFALNVPSDTFKSNLNNPAKLGELLGPAGVNPAHEVVVVSGKGITKEAALAFVALDKAGQKKVSILTDPADKWAQPGYELKKEPTAVGPKKGPMDLSIVPVVYSPKPRDVVVSDTNSTRGAYPKVFIASGQNMPAKTPDGKVVHVAYTDLLNADGTPKAAKDIWSTLSKAGVPRFAEIVVFSDDPGDAAVNYYLLKLMGFPDVKVLAM